MITYTREKPCMHCGGHEFYINGRGCRPCVLAREAERYQDPAYREKKKLVNARWRATGDNRKKALEANRRWYEQNKEYVRLYKQARKELKQECAA